MTLPEFEQVLDEALATIPGTLTPDQVPRLLTRFNLWTLTLVSAAVLRKPLAPVVPGPGGMRIVKSAEAARLLGISPALLSQKVNTDPAYKALLVNNGSRIRSYYVDRIEALRQGTVR